MQRLPFPASKSFIRSRRSKLSLTALALGVNGTTPTTSLPSAIFAARLAADMVNGARKLLFTVPFTAPFTLQAWEALGDTEVVNFTWTQAEHRTGLERPHFGQVLVAKRPHGSLQPKTLVACKYFARVPRKRDETGSAIIGDRSEGGKNSTLHFRHCNFFTFGTPQDTRCREDAFRERSKSSRQKLSEMGGSDPTIWASIRPNGFSGSLPPITLVTRSLWQACKDRTNQVRMRALLMRACKKEKPSANSESTTKTTEECNVAASY